MKQEGTVLFTWLDYALLAVTAIVSLGLGLYPSLATGRQNTTDEYLMGGRRLRIFPVAVSLTVSYTCRQLPSLVSLQKCTTLARVSGSTLLVPALDLQLLPFVTCLFSTL